MTSAIRLFKNVYCFLSVINRTRSYIKCPKWQADSS